MLTELLKLIAELLLYLQVQEAKMTAKLKLFSPGIVKLFAHTQAGAYTCTCTRFHHNTEKTHRHCVRNMWFELESSAEEQRWLAK